MATITEDYVSFEIAKLLKEKGFEGDINTYYHIWDNGNKVCSVQELNHSEAPHLYIPAPTLQMAMKWLREVHNVAIVVAPSIFWGKYNVSIYKKGNDYPIGFDGDSFCPSYERACEAAIKYCLENLI